MKIEIRPLEISDLEDVKEIALRFSERVKPSFWTKEIKNLMKRDPKGCLVAVVENKIVGFIIGGVREWQFGLEEGGWIEVIGVLPEYMGHGIGKRLSKALFEHFKSKNIKTVYTLCLWNSSSLIDYFASLGFERGNLINLVKKLE
ncbi:MAG: GNAT family N-acetyltransferase [Candidatus Methanofastidiosia archaeon]